MSRAERRSAVRQAKKPGTRKQVKANPWVIGGIFGAVVLFYISTMLLRNF